VTVPVALHGLAAILLRVTVLPRLRVGRHSKVAATGTGVAVRFCGDAGVAMAAAVLLMRSIAVAVTTAIPARFGRGRDADCERRDSCRKNIFAHDELLRFNASTKLNDCAFPRRGRFIGAKRHPSAPE
jgi:hypothetical protein